jgi:hypothetical protein
LAVRSGERICQLVEPALIAAVEDQRFAIGCEPLRERAAEPVGRTLDEDRSELGHACSRTALTRVHIQVRITLRACASVPISTS